MQVPWPPREKRIHSEGHHHQPGPHIRDQPQDGQRQRHHNKAANQQRPTTCAIEPEHRWNTAQHETQADHHITQRGAFSNTKAQQANNLRAKSVNGEHRDHLAGPDGRDKQNKWKVTTIKQLKKTGFLRCFFVEHYRFTEQFDHHRFTLFHPAFSQ